MRVCKDLQLPKMSPDSTVHFQQCYYAEELPIAQLEKIQGDIGMAGQITARLKHCEHNHMPHSDGPPRSAAEQH
jgi:hypothetical protein